MGGTTQRNMAHAAVVVMLMTLCSRALGFVREQVIASHFGATGMTDAYLAAVSVPQIISALLGGAIASAFVPVYLRYLAQDEEQQAQYVAVATSCLLGLSLLLATAVSFIAAPAIVCRLVPSFAPDKMRMTTTLMRIMLPCGPLAGLSTFVTALLNARRHFGWPALSGVVLNLGVIAATLALGATQGVVGLAWATLLGSGLQFCFLLWLLRRYSVGINLSFSWPGRPKAADVFANAHGSAHSVARCLVHSGLRRVIILATPVMLGSLLGELNGLVTRGIASGLPPGSISALSYSTQLAQLPIGLLVTPLCTVIYPTLAEYAGRGDRAGLADATGAGLRLLSMLLAPAAAATLILRVPMVQLAFERGSFDHGATLQTAVALGYYALGLPGVASIQFLTRAFHSVQDAVTALWVSIAAAPCNICLSWALVRSLGHGGLALANSLTMLGCMLALVLLLQKKTGAYLVLAPTLPRVCIAAALTGLLAVLTYPSLASLGLLISLCGTLLVCGATYIGLLLVLRVEETSWLLHRYL